MPGIYTITNTINNKMYVGFATDFETRWSSHLSELQLNKHHSDRLQNSWNKYGKDVFLFEVLVECEEEHLCSEEHYWATILNVHNDQYGYNIRPTDPNGRSKHSEYSINKMRIIQKELANTLERLEWAKLRMIGKQYGKGHKVSEEHKEILRKISTGRKASPETRKKMSDKKLGGKRSLEVIENHRKKVTGKKRTGEQKLALSIAKLGVPQPGNYRPVIKLDTITNSIVEYESVGTAAKDNGVSKNALSYSLKNGSIWHKQYKWFYKDTYNENTNN